MQGFMLFEVMITLVLLCFCSTLGFFYYRAVDSRSPVQDCALLSLLFHTAATRAVCTKKEQVILFDLSTNSSLFDGQRFSLSPGYSFGTVGNDVHGPPSAPHKRIHDPITFVNHTAVAYPDGTLQAGSLYIKRGDHQYALTTPVSACSRVRSYQYRDKKWYTYP